MEWKPVSLGIIDLVTPFLVVLMVLEGIIAWRVGKKDWFRINDAVGSLLTGLFMQVLGILTYVFLFVTYYYLAKDASLPALLHTPEWPMRAVWTGTGIDWAALGWWLLAFLAVDFVFYWFHRFAHRVNVAWASHVVHHSSEEYNLSVGLRHGFVENFFSAPFYLLFALVGMPWPMFFLCYALNIFWQFWVHTRMVRSLGPLEWLFSTPSHHRVHHGRNARYIDKNYGGTLIIWDRMFGTFEPEVEEAVYGNTKPVHAFNPLYLNAHGYIEIAQAILNKPRQLFGLLLMPPGWQPAGTPPAPAEPGTALDRPKFDPPIPLAQQLYALVQFGFCVYAGTEITAYSLSADFQWAYLLFWIFMALFGMSCVGFLLEDSPLALGAETTRLVAILLTSGSILLGRQFPLPNTLAIFLLALVSLVLLWVIYRGKGRWQEQSHSAPSVS